MILIEMVRGPPGWCESTSDKTPLESDACCSSEIKKWAGDPIRWSRGRPTLRSPHSGRTWHDDGVLVSRKRVAQTHATLSSACTKRRGRRKRARPTTRRTIRSSCDSPAPGPRRPGCVAAEATGPALRATPDITYVNDAIGNFLCLAVVLDVFSRRIVGWAMDSSRFATEQSLVGALEIERSPARSFRSPEEVIHHSDFQGSQYDTSYLVEHFCSSDAHPQSAVGYSAPGVGRSRTPLQLPPSRPRGWAETERSAVSRCSRGHQRK